MLAYACGADPLYYEETDAVVTIRGKEDFSQYRTYYLPETIVDLCLQPSSGSPTSSAIGGAAGGPSIDPGNCDPTDRAADEAILEALERNMDALGYERVAEEDRAEADLALLVGFVSRLTWSLDRPYCYPESYYGGCVSQSDNPPWSVRPNTLILQLVDVESSTDTDLVSVWSAAIARAQEVTAELGQSLGGGPSETKERIWEAGIEQAFSQSTYLNEGGN